LIDINTGLLIALTMFPMRNSLHHHVGSPDTVVVNLYSAEHFAKMIEFKLLTCRVELVSIFPKRHANMTYAITH
jgi:hypothetical protein